MKNFFIALLLVAFAFPAKLFAYDFEAGGLYYNILPDKVNEVEVTYKTEASRATDYTGTLSIPESVSYQGTTYKVSAIGAKAFFNCKNLTGPLIIPNTVTSIGDYAFYGCSGLSGSLVIPNSVTSTGNSVFSGCTSLTSITIPNSVTNIGFNAFSGCTGLTSVTIPDSVTSIGDGAFNNCSGLTTVIIGNSVTSIGYYAFSGCSGLTSIIVDSNNTKYDSRDNCNAITETTSNTIIVGCKNTIIPNSVTSIGKGAFQGCSDLISFTIPNSVTSIGEGAFAGCTELSTVTIPNSVVNIGYDAFSGTAWYNNQPDGLVYAGKVAYKYKGQMPANTAITIEDGTLGIADYAFADCSNLTSVIIPNSVTSIGESCFEMCGKLQSVSLSTNMTRIGKFAFYHCSSLISITIPEKIDSIGLVAFGGCTHLSSIHVEKGNKTFDSRDDCNAIVKTSANMLVVGCTKSTFPSSVKSIGKYAFSVLEQLTSVTIPSSISQIEDRAFDGCYRLDSVIVMNETPIPIKATTFDPKHFLFVPTGCREAYAHADYWKDFYDIVEPGELKNGDVLTAETIEGVTMTFHVLRARDRTCELTECLLDVQSDDAPTSITIPEEVKGFSVVSIGAAFYNLKSLISVTIPNSVTSIGHSAFSDCTGLTNITIPNSVTSIGLAAFSNCSKLTAVAIPDAVTIIRDRTFSGCSNLMSITIPNSVITIDNSAFLYCTGLTTITIPNSVTSIGYNAFSGCSGLTSVVIPSSVTSIGSGAFENCNNLSSIKVEADNSIYDSRNSCNAIVETASNTLIVGCKNTTIPNTIVCIGNYAFESCHSLTSVVIPNSVVSIGERAFSRCDALISVIIPNSIVSIRSNAFQYCSKLASVSIPKSVKAIGSNAFSGCYALNVVKSYIKKPFEIDQTVFSNISNNSELYVPYGTRSAYEALDGWRVFGTIIESAPESYEINVVAIGNGSVTYNGNTIRNQSKSISVLEESDIQISLYPDDGYKVLKVVMDNNDVTEQIVDNVFTITNVSGGTNVEITFGPQGPTTHQLTISATGNGSVSFGGKNIRNSNSSFTIDDGAYISLALMPDEGYRVKKCMLNATDISEAVANNQYSINKMTADATINVEFGESITNLTKDGINYIVASSAGNNVLLTSGNYGQVLTVPASFSEKGEEWRVVGVDETVKGEGLDCAAVIWNADATFNGKLNNPNVLLYVKAAAYASEDIQNCIVDGTAENIVLTDAASGNTFYCPRAFVAKSITYEHNYSMKTGYQTCQGWETLVLPFDVTKVLRQSTTELLPYDAWTAGSAARPFWLYSLTELGWKAETAITANTPYIIGMPNNENYEQSYNISGNIQFVGTNVQVKASDNLYVGKRGNKRLVPSYQYQESVSDIYALNVNNLWSQATGGETEGSTFIRALRPVHPFEAYMTVEGANAPNCIPIFGDDESTGIVDLEPQEIVNRQFANSKYYDLQGRRVNSRPHKKGLYIQRGKKTVIR